MKPVYATLGSVSSGTMRAEDLVPAFLSALEDVRNELAVPGSTTDSAEETLARSQEVGRLDDVLGEIEERMNAEIEPDSDEEGYFDGEEASEDLQTLEDELSNYSPPFCRFGAHEGDGADYGFWISWESVEEAVREGTLIKLEAGAEWPEGELAESPDCEGVLYVTDHGNATLHAADGTELWSVV